MPTRASTLFLFVVAIPLFLVLLADLHINPAFVNDDFYGFGKFWQLYFMAYVLLPFALFWYFLGLVPGVLLVQAIFGLHVLFFGLYILMNNEKKPDPRNEFWTAAYVGSYFLAYVLVPFLLAWHVFGLYTGAALTLALLGLSALWNAILFTSPRRKLEAGGVTRWG